MTNPLLATNSLPLFDSINPDHIEEAIDQILSESRTEISALLEGGGPYNWCNLVEPLEAIDDRLSRAWSPVSHLNSVLSSDELRSAYNACLPKLTEYSTEMGQNRALYEAWQSLSEGEVFKQLNATQQKIVNDALRDFRLSGIALEGEAKSRFKEIAQSLSKSTSKFEENLLDATNDWNKLILDVGQLKGLPENAIALAKQEAENRKESGWMLTLEFPSYIAVMTFADDRQLRREMYEAFSTRASECGPGKGQWDNSEVMEEILALRHEEANLLGFDNFATVSLATKMAETPEQVVGFLVDLAERSQPIARKDFAELGQFAKEERGVEKLEAWDIGYYSEKLRQHRFDLSQEEVKQYFPDTKVIAGLFVVVKRLFGLNIKEQQGVETWHKDVRFFEIRDNEDNLRGQFFLDPYARGKKRGGAWMDVCISRRKLKEGIQTPVAYLTCNFTPPVGDAPALLTHDEVITLFHEFGHGLHHMLTKVDEAAVSGISGVEWDAVELPSQFLENWCWEKESLALISSHYQTGEPLPDSLFDKMIAAKNFQSGMLMMRQLEFSLFDFKMHEQYQADKGGRIYPLLNEIRDQYAVVPIPEFNRFAHGFSHIFAGGYAAGYYSYKWAEVLSSDAFSLFEENGIFDAETGRSFLENILEKGGSQEAMQLFIAFRGREPKIDALLRHCGIAG
ncbi:MAG: oligopeptidase A [Gammaproteobacteria bacterium]|nr:MAG: oligopeptidase A [Gammaproteobacteria bacterium]